MFNRVAYSMTEDMEHFTEPVYITEKDNTKNFCRVFKQIVGTTPTRYRTSHEIKDMCYSGDYCELDMPYERPTYTYVPSARKCIDWKTPLEYIRQRAEKPG